MTTTATRCARGWPSSKPCSALRIAEVARVKSDLDAFEIDYRKRVGILHEQLDKLELEIAEAELGELSKRLAGRVDGST